MENCILSKVLSTQPLGHRPHKVRNSQHYEGCFLRARAMVLLKSLLLRSGRSSLILPCHRTFWLLSTGLALSTSGFSLPAAISLVLTSFWHVNVLENKLLTRLEATARTFRVSSEYEESLWRSHLRLWGILGKSAPLQRPGFLTTGRIKEEWLFHFKNKTGNTHMAPRQSISESGIDFAKCSYRLSESQTKLAAS